MGIIYVVKAVCVISKELLSTCWVLHLAQLLTGSLDHPIGIELLENVKGAAQVDGELVVIIVQMEE